MSGTAVVVGAGVFGASTARELARRGWDVRVVEQYAAGNVRSGSGGDTRLLRFSHGDVDWYTLMARRALELWLELEEETGMKLFEPVGVAWFETGDDDFTRKSEATLSRLGIACERLTPEDAQHLYPSLGGDDLRSVLLEPGAGVLFARRATRCLVRNLRVETGRPTPIDPPRADIVVWACGAWLPGLFPALVQQRISRRDVFFFGVDGSWSGTPGYCDYEGPYYGHGELGGLGLKTSYDGPGVEIDPDQLERLPDPASEALARSYVAQAVPCARRRTADRRPRLPVRPDRSTRTFSSTGTPSSPDGGCWAAAQVTGSSTALRSPNTSRTASKAAASPSRSTALGPRTGHAGLRTATSA